MACSRRCQFAWNASALLLWSLTKFTSAATSQTNFLGSNQQDLLLELEAIVGRDHRIATESRVSRLEEVLRPTFASMPKDNKGTMHAAGVRYMLHRLFVQRHGWFINGISYDGSAWNSSSPATVFKEHAENHQELFQNHLNSQGFSLHQVAVFAATLEVLVHGESTERLEAAYRGLDLAPSESLTESQAVEVMVTYMMLYVSTKTNLSSLNPISLRKVRADVLSLYPTFPDTVKFSHEVRNAVLEDVPADQRTTWATNLRVIEEIAERYGRWQDKECQSLKQQLMQDESPGTGRVRLSDFYRDNLASTSKTEGYFFRESIEYLRTLGALDETDPEHMSVIIPNYISSPTNCIASSKFYIVCCIDECEELLGTLENELASPDATPARIIELISKLPSKTVEAPRILSTALVQRLEEIASHHGGRVPLHSRLFTQWMHHVYPRECQYPHLSGTTSPMMDDKARKAGIKLDATKMEMRALVRKTEARKRAQINTELSVPWNPEEEIFVPHLQHRLGTNFVVGFIRFLAFAAVAFALVSAIVRMLPSLGSKAGSFSDHKYYV